MARRRESVLELLVMAPWWVSVLMLVGAFVFVAYVIPAILGQQHRLFGPLAQQLPSLAPMIALVFLLPAPVSAFRQWRARRLLHSQTGLDSIRAMSWQRFETLVAEAYRCAGYSVEETGGGGPDGGIDLIARKGGTFLVQCKQWKAYQVGVKEVRELFGLVAAERAAGGVLITSGRFTIDAQAFARGKPLDLIDGPRLLELVRLVQNGQSAVPTTTSTPEKADDAAVPPICSACGRRMVLRTSRRGGNAGHRFWGCSGYPGCRGTASV